MPGQENPSLPSSVFFMSRHAWRMVSCVGEWESDVCAIPDRHSTPQTTHQPAHSDAREQEPIAVKRVQTNETLAHVEEALRGAWEAESENGWRHGMSAS